MRHLDVYYALRRFIPRALQVRLRQEVVRRQRRRYGDVWPVLESAGRTPVGWQGWPDGKRFAFVLTHDVEGPGGLARCLRLADLEEQAGFRSSFNFIPAARYEVPAALRDELRRRGFEVGVHGLYHDGQDFSSRAVFQQRCPVINRYLAEWGARGFRAPSMRSNLDWIRDLQIEYDSSTFDTDPFEPIPQGVHTIFPFRVPGRDGGPGYVELPYTLPQDFTIFVLLGEPGIDTWKKKLEWIASRGGMALLDIHPDYMGFGSPCGLEKYPAERYVEFLGHVKQTYAGQYWHALPAEVARYCAAPGRVRTGRPRHICMMAYAFYENDNRIIRYAETLSARGDEVDVISLRREGQSAFETIRGVRVHRVQFRQRDEKSKLDYLVRMLRFLWTSSRTLNRLHARNPFHLIHVHSVPDFEVFAAWRPKVAGARVILDIHDLVPEFYGSKFKVDSRSALFRWLTRVERLAAGFADHVIIANNLWFGKLTARSVPFAKCTTLLNYVDLAAFRPRPKSRRDGRFLFIYPGGLQWHQGLDIALRAFAKAAPRMPGAEFHLYGEGSEKERLAQLVRELGLADRARLLGVRPYEEVPQLIAEADVGVVAKRADSFGNEAYSTKILEFMSQGLPVLVSRTAIDQYYFPEDVVKFYTSGNEDEMAAAMVRLYESPEERARLAERGRRYLAENNWDVKKSEYLDLVDRLTAAWG